MIGRLVVICALKVARRAGRVLPAFPIPLLSLQPGLLGAAYAGFACAGFDFLPGSPTAHNTNDLVLPYKKGNPTENSFRSNLQNPNDLCIP